MMDEIVKLMGAHGVIPAAMVVLAGYVIATFIGLHRTRSQQRVEFLNLWKGIETMDDMELEMVVRHHWGTYLPASVIRKVCQNDYCAHQLAELSDLWTLFRFDLGLRQVTWERPEYASRKTLGSRRWIWVAGYFVFSFVAFIFLGVAFAYGPTKLLSWISGFNALLFPVLAFGALGRSETFGLAYRVGHAWLERLNGSVLDAEVPALEREIQPSE
jgi:hypothetical protein